MSTGHKLGTKNIYLDCDGVLLDSPAAKANFFNAKFNCKFNGNQYPSQWDYSGTGFDLHTSTNLFLESAEFEQIPPIEGAQAAVRLLANAGYKIQVVTSISDIEAVKFRRIRNLERLFGKVFDDVIMFPLGWNNKISFYRASPHGTVIDDSIFNIQDALSCGHNAVFITIEHNINWHSFAKKQGLVTANSLYEAVRSNKIR